MLIRFLGKTKAIYNGIKTGIKPNEEFEVEADEGKRLIEQFPSDFEIVVIGEKYLAPKYDKKVIIPKRSRK